MTRWTFKSNTGLRWHSGALLYALGAYAAGFWLLLTSSWWGLVPGALLLGHGMIIAAYLIHECAHIWLKLENAIRNCSGNCARLIIIMHNII